MFEIWFKIVATKEFDSLDHTKHLRMPVPTWQKVTIDTEKKVAYFSSTGTVINGRLTDEEISLLKTIETLA